MARDKQIYQLYLDLYRKHGDPARFWPQWCSRNKSLTWREVVAIGAILTQRTSWHNADLALRNLRKHGLLSLSAIAGLRNLNRLTEVVRPAGFFRTKPRRLFELASFIVDNYGDLETFAREDLKAGREKLLGLYGIGLETADTILLYALDKPTFVIDEYTKRLVIKKRLSEKFDYDHLQSVFENSLPREVRVYQNFHTLIIVDQKGEEASMMEMVE